MNVSVNRLQFGIPHCQVCPRFLGQSVPVVRTNKGYGLFCEVCELGHGPIVVRSTEANRMAFRLDDPAEKSGADEEE